jgi:DNA-binding CsgD family transcriptional regulator
VRDLDLEVIDLARRLSALPDADSYYAVTPSLLAEVIPADQVFWTRTDFLREAAEVRGDTTAGPRLAEALGRFGPSHPAIQTYVADPSDLRPRRMSDVADQRTWHASAVYAEAFAGFGTAHQLSMVSSVSLPGTGCGWTLTRSGSDFTDGDLELAGRLLPVLLVLDRVHGADGPARGAGTSSTVLTRRERDVLAALADGLTAGAIGRRHGITERTVRKHLAALYGKLHCHDRLLAVSRARELGLLPDRDVS